jgi:hypothetical protein
MARVEETDGTASMRSYWSTWPQLDALRRSVSEFYEMLDNAEPWVHELAEGDMQFGRLAMPITTAMVSLEALMWEFSGIAVDKPGILFDGRVWSQGSRRWHRVVNEREARWRRRHAWQHVRALGRATVSFLTGLDRAKTETMEPAKTDPQLRGIVRLCIGALTSTGLLRDLVDNLSMTDPPSASKDESLPDCAEPRLEVLGLSVRAFKCLTSAEIRTVYDILDMTESELLCLPNLGRGAMDEIKDRLVTTGYLGAEQRDTFFRLPVERLEPRFAS